MVILHKDMGVEAGEPVSSDDIIAEFHRNAPYIRVGVESGEWPDGLKHVRDIQRADFYLDFENLGSSWTLNQVKKGWVNKLEQTQRGKQIEMPPPGASQERFMSRR